MSNTLIEKSRTIKTHANNCNVTEQNVEILLRLQKAIGKLNEARKEIHTTVQLAMKLKENGDDIADQVMIGVIEAFTCYTNFLALKNEIQDNN